MRGSLAGLRAVVVGGGGGIGAATTEELCREGARVVCADRDDAAAGVLAARLRADGAEVGALGMDVTEPRQVADGFERAVEQLGGLDACIYAAGVTSTADVADMAFAEWRRVLGVNLDGAFLVAQQAIAPLAQAGGGVLVLVGSQLARAATPGKAHYIASKGALEALTRALAVELAPSKVRVVCLAPGPTRSGMLLERLGDDPEALRAALEPIPLGRFAEPAEIAATAAFLLSPAAAFVTGTTWVVDGGYQAR